MNIKKFFRTLKTGAEYFSTTAGAAAFIFGLITTLVTVSFAISMPITIAIGLTFGYIGMRRALQREAEADVERTQREEFQQGQGELLERTRELDKKISEVVVLEHKIEEDLQHDHQLQLQASPQNFTANLATFFQSQSKAPTVMPALLAPRNSDKRRFSWS